MSIRLEDENHASRGNSQRDTLEPRGRRADRKDRFRDPEVLQKVMDLYQIVASAVRTIACLDSYYPEYVLEVLKDINSEKLRYYSVAVLPIISKLAKRYPNQVKDLFAYYLGNGRTNVVNEAIPWMGKCLGYGIDNFIIEQVEAFKNGKYNAAEFMRLIPDLARYDLQYALDLAEYGLTTAELSDRVKRYGAIMLGHLVRMCDFQNYHLPSDAPQTP